MRRRPRWALLVLAGTRVIPESPHVEVHWSNRPKTIWRPLLPWEGWMRHMLGSLDLHPCKDQLTVPPTTALPSTALKLRQVQSVCFDVLISGSLRGRCQQTLFSWSHQSCVIVVEGSSLYWLVAGVNTGGRFTMSLHWISATFGFLQGLIATLKIPSS